MTEVSVKCSCGSINGVIHKVTPKLGARVICYCDDCQSFAHYLEHENAILDEFGGTDVVQLPLSHLKITKGSEHIQCLRLTSKGMFRWYAGCCKTPIGFTMAAGVPFVGLIHNFVEDAKNRDKYFGPALGRLQTKFATGELPAKKNQRSMLNIVAKSLFKLLIWKLRGFNKPSVFFNEKGNPIVEPKILKAA
jgi:hypothetical protein